MSVRRRPRRELEGLGWLARGHSFATRAPTWCGRVRCGATQGMFSRADALSDCNKLSTHTSFEAQNPSAWDYDWASVTCTTPSPPATPPEPPTSPPPPLLSEKASLEAALGEWCADAAAAQATHGPISAWDVSTVTDMASLLHGLTCSSTFDEDLNAWDVRQVTDMRVRRRPRREPEGLGWLAGGAVLCHQSTDSVGACGVARHRECSALRALSTSLWKRGTFARSRTWGCAAVPSSGAGGVEVVGWCRGPLPHTVEHTRWPGHGHASASPPALGAERVGGLAEGGPLPPEHTHTQPARVRRRGAGHVRLHLRFQPARCCVGRWSGYQHECAPPPALGAEGVGLGWLAGGRSFATLDIHTGAPTHSRRARAVWCGAEHVSCGERFQPARGRVGREPCQQHDGAPPPFRGERSRRGWGGAWAQWGRLFASGAPMHLACACGGVWRSKCSTTRALSTSPWKRGTSVGSPA